MTDSQVSDDEIEDVDDILDEPDPLYWTQLSDWYEHKIAKSKSAIFPTYERARHFVRQNEAELAAAGAMIRKGGRGGIIVRPDFEKYVLRIVARYRQRLSPGLRATTPLHVWEAGAISGPVASERAAPAIPPAPARAPTPSGPLTPAARPSPTPSAAATSGAAKKLPAWRQKLRAETQS